MKTIQDFSHTRTISPARQTLIEILDAVISLFVMLTFLVLCGGILYLLHG